MVGTGNGGLLDGYQRSTIPVGKVFCSNLRVRKYVIGKKKIGLPPILQKHTNKYYVCVYEYKRIYTLEESRSHMVALYTNKLNEIVKKNVKILEAQRFCCACVLIEISNNQQQYCSSFPLNQYCKVYTRQSDDTYTNRERTRTHI